MNNWIFNAWGNKYVDLLEDNSIPEKINKCLKMADSTINNAGTLDELRINLDSILKEIGNVD